jgi:hypothetical protein
MQFSNTFHSLRILVLYASWVSKLYFVYDVDRVDISMKKASYTTDEVRNSQWADSCSEKVREFLNLFFFTM